MKIMRNLKRISALLLTVFVTLGLVQPAKAATPVTITIWSFGNVIEPWAITEYKKLHPEVTLQIKKGELDAHHVGGEEMHGLTQHGGFAFDATDTPAQHPEAIDHGGVAVGAHQGVGVAHAIGAPVDAAGQVLQVHLVHDAKARRHDAKGGEGLHAPFEKGVALTITLKLELHVQVERVTGIGRPGRIR